MKKSAVSKAARMTEARRVARLAREYRQQGYEVERNVPMGDGLNADLRVRKGDQTIVIAVETWESIRKDGEGTVELARRLTGVPGMRFDLVMTAPRKRRIPVPAQEKH